MLLLPATTNIAIYIYIYIFLSGNKSMTYCDCQSIINPIFDSFEQNAFMITCEVFLVEKLHKQSLRYILKIINSARLLTK